MGGKIASPSGMMPSTSRQEAQAAAKQRLLYALAVGFLVLSLVLAALRELLGFIRR